MSDHSSKNTPKNTPKDTPIYRLKQRARSLAKAQGIPLHEALDSVARAQGHTRWSALSAAHRARRAADTLRKLAPGDLALVGARPKQGKTRLCLALLARATAEGHQAFFFSLDYTQAEAAARLRESGSDGSDCAVRIDCGERITAEHISRTTRGAPSGSVIVVDYLQALDQDRSAPVLAEQVEQLRKTTQDRGHICLVISQIDRAFERSKETFPAAQDVRLPNPVDLAQFNRQFYLCGGDVLERAATG